jgi:hypothetical protein
MPDKTLGVDFRQKLGTHILDHQSEIMTNFVKNTKTMVASQLVEVVEMIASDNDEL